MILPGLHGLIEVLAERRVAEVQTVSVAQLDWKRNWKLGFERVQAWTPKQKQPEGAQMAISEKTVLREHTHEG